MNDIFEFGFNSLEFWIIADDPKAKLLKSVHIALQQTF